VLDVSVHPEGAVFATSSSDAKVRQRTPRHNFHACLLLLLLLLLFAAVVRVQHKQHTKISSRVPFVGMLLILMDLL